jgi:fluoroquinolone transport system ATP-binding protein
VIDVQDLSYVYPGAQEAAVKGISFAVQPGEIFGFLGPSGAGKSTTQKVLIRLLKDFGGAARVLGRDLCDWNEDYYEQIGVGFELPNHYGKLTALENLRFFGSLYRRAIIDPLQLLDAVGLGDATNMPVAQFSKGMKMRLNFVRALLHQPKLLFLDEPTSGLDPVNARLIKELIQAEKAKGTTIFLTTHNMIDADELCDRVAFMVDGVIALIDAPRELKIKRGKALVQVEYRVNSHVERRQFPLAELGNNQDFARLIQQHEVETIHTQEATLEDVFVQATGRTLL